jgi:chromate transport protein ChrA
MSGAGGLIAEISGGRLTINLGTLATALVAIGITWVTNIYEIIAYASKAFVLYYALQSATAAYLAWRQRRMGRMMLYWLAVLLAVVIFVFAIPAEI